MLVDRSVLVTGASSGIGRACAEAFVAAGAQVAACARRADRLQQLPDEVETFVLDVRDRQAAAQALAGRAVDILVNNAGLAAGFEPLWEGDPADWERMLDTNVKGLLWVTRAVTPGMVERGSGHVINIGSVAGRETYPDGAVYCASKAAVNSITQGLRMDLLGTGVKVSTVDPGMVETEFSVVRFAGDNERAAQVYEGLTPLTADDVADAVLWVADRPAHVQITDVVIFPTDQASATRVRRRRVPGPRPRTG